MSEIFDFVVVPAKSGTEKALYLNKMRGLSNNFFSDM